MKLYRLNLLFFFLMQFCFSSTAYCDYETEFITKLKQNGYNELALHHLDQLKTDGRVPPSLKKTLDYERAKILIELARTTSLASKQREMLDEANASLELFISKNRNHALVGEASSEKGRILLEYARAELRKSSNESEKNRPFQEKARKYLDEAKFIFDQALEINEKEFKKFELYIKSDEKEKREQRNLAEQRYISSLYRQAICIYELSKTYEYDKKEEKAIRQQAFKKFDNIYSRYRTVVVGLYARMWQGKCYEDDGEYKKALGVYEGLLSHPDQSPAVINLQHQVTLFRLVCLNHRKMAQYQLLIKDATYRLDKFSDLAKSRFGLEIRWQRALALKRLADSKDINDSKRESYLRLSLGDAQEVSKFPGELRTQSVKLMTELNEKLGYKKKARQSFSTAYFDSKEMIDQVTLLQQAIVKAENNSDRQNKKREFLAHLEETRKQLEKTIELSNDNEKKSELNNLRYLLSYIYYLTEENEKAAVLAGFVGHFYKKEFPTIALDASYISAVSYLKIYESSKGDKKTELKWISNSADYLIKNWPGEKYSNEITFAVAKIFHKEKQFLIATDWFNRISTESDYYGKALIAAGQSYWSSVLESYSSGKPNTEQIPEWKKKAKESLLKGIRLIEDKLSDKTDIPEDLIVAKTILSQIYIRNKKYEEALEVLSDGDYSVVDYMSKIPSGTRPEIGPRSQEFASYYYQMLLRCYVATQQIDLSLEVMNQLDQLASGNQDSISTIYVNLGKVIQREIEELIAEKKTAELAEIQDSFDRFLTELYDRRESMKYGGLIWVAETYYGLASGLKKTNSAKAKMFTEKALTTYEAILGRSDVPEKNILSIKLRQIKCLQQQEDYKRSYQYLLQLLNEHPSVLDLQIEAAMLLEEWGSSGDLKKYLLAINGDPLNKKQKQVWGWGNIAKRIQRILLESGSNSSTDRLMTEKYWNSRFHVSSCRRKYANKIKQADEKEKMLLLAQREIEVFASLSDHITDEWVEKFDQLYSRIQNGLNPKMKKTTPLNWGEVIVTNSTHKNNQSKIKEKAKSVSKETNPKKRSGGPKNSYSSTTIIGGSALALIIITGLGYLVMSGKKKPKHHIHQLREQPFKQPSSPKRRRRPSKPKSSDSHN